VHHKGTAQWLQKIAANGNAVAQEFLGRAYEEGWLGLAKDEVQARYWYQQAARRSTPPTDVN
jgi:TPR repeat protein